MPRPSGHPEIEQLYSVEYGALYRVALVIVRDPGLADDLVSEGFTRLIQNWPRISRYESPGGWLRRVVIREAVRTRDRRAHESVSQTSKLDAVSSAVDGPLTESPVLAAVARLPRQMRAVVSVHYLMDLSVDRTAELLGLRPGTVKAHLNHARSALRESLGTDAMEVLQDG